MSALLTMGAVAPQDPDEYPARDLIHSELPLYSFDDAEFWPRSFVDKDSWGCTSRVAFGDWRFVPDPRNEYQQESWYRFSNYGVFHCAAIVQQADERADLEGARYEYGFFVKIGETKIADKLWELWAIQQGMVPGSDYTLLARRAGAGGLIDEFTVLQQECPTGHLRRLKSGGLDIWRTEYCAINSRMDLLELAKRMVEFAPVGTIKRVPDEKEPSDERPDSSSHGN